MSAGDELYVRSLFSSDEVRKEVEEYLHDHFKYLLRKTLVKPEDIHSDFINATGETALVKQFVATFTEKLLRNSVKEELLKVYVRDKLHEHIDEAVEVAIQRKLEAFEKQFKRNKTIPKGVRK